MKKVFSTIAIVLALLIQGITITHAQDLTFTIEQIDASGKATQVASSPSYDEAVRIFQMYAQEKGNVILRDQSRIWNMKYGIGVLKKSDTCDYNVTYTQGTKSGYTNGCYGIDAAYLSTNADGSFMDLMISNTQGSFSSDDVTLLPIEQSAAVSMYQVQDGILYHLIKSQMEDDRVTSTVQLGKAPKELSEGASYYSYDSHYFYPVDVSYQGFYDMIDDYKVGTHAHAVNASAPYYNYYQYLTHRSTTNYSEAEINSYISDHLFIHSPLTSYRSIGNSAHAVLTQSILKDQGCAFLTYQDAFGVNALMMMALSMNESAVGRSYLAYTRNNLFGHAAFDSAVEENASRYDTVSASIYSHALHYINNSYLNPEQFQFHGGWFGNKASGMNVSYASDPYWGEKAAQYYERIDQALGYKDEDVYALGIVQEAKEVIVYQEPSEGSTQLYTSGGLADFSFILLGETDGWYKIQSDPSYSTTSVYDYEASVGYVRKSDIDLVLHKEKMRERTRIPIQFDAGDGTFENKQTTLSLEVEAGHTPSVLPPKKDGYLFRSWKEELTPAARAVTYHAQYEKITKAEMTTLPKQTYETGDFLDVKGGILTLTLESGDAVEVPLDSTMVSGYDSEQSGEQTLDVWHQGAHATYTVQVNKRSGDEETLLSHIQSIVEEAVDEQNLSTALEDQILALKQELDVQDSPTVSQSVYRKLDRLLQKAYGNSLQILLSDDGVDFQVSGLAIAQPMGSPTFFPNVLKLRYEDGVSEDAKQQLSDIAEGNGYTLESCFQLSGSYNLQDLTLHDDVIFSIQKPASAQPNTQYFVLRYEDGEVVQVTTQQSSDRITFVSNQLGEYALVSLTTTNTFTGEDVMENNTLDHNGIDFFKLLLYAGGATILLILLILTILIRKKRKNKSSKKKKHKKSHTRKQEDSSLAAVKEPASFLSRYHIEADDPLPTEEEDKPDA